MNCLAAMNTRVSHAFLGKKGANQGGGQVGKRAGFI